ncbi:redoxin domain-containing protein [Mucilaginibacter ximonensis]|uniref:Redoxin domain-containing protein n=2 Tax=Mucilaginibacter ximonensis TaxID=538021 RepID=A0ABW5YGI4_9SPHI
MLNIIALLPVMVFAQAPAGNSFTVTGKISNLTTPARMYILYRAGANKIIDSTLLADGSFTITGSIPSPSNALLVLDHKGIGITKLGNGADALEFMLDKGTTNVNTTKDSVKHAEITGSVINDEDKYLTQQLNYFNNEAKKLNDEAKATPEATQKTPEFQSKMQARFKALQSKQHDMLKDFVATHPHSYESLMVLNLMNGQGANPFETGDLYSKIDQDLRDTEVGKMIRQNIDDAKVTAVGAVAPDFTQPDVNGAPVKLSSFKGKYVLIDFWASWCGPCRAENPNVVKAYNKYKAKNFTILGVSLDRQGEKDKWLEAIKHDGLTWTQVSDLKAWYNEVAALYKVQSIPANFLIDPNGKIIARDLRGADLEQKLAELFEKI